MSHLLHRWFMMLSSPPLPSSLSSSSSSSSYRCWWRMLHCELNNCHWWTTSIAPTFCTVHSHHRHHQNHKIVKTILAYNSNPPLIHHHHHRHYHHHQHPVPKMCPAKLISGKEVSDEIRARLRDTVSRLSITPLLAIVQVGGREDSNVYIRMKKNFAESVGAKSIHVQLPQTITQVELEKEVQKLNADSTVHGIIVQLPFDSIEKIDAHYITNLIAPQKDVDGLTVINSGNLLHGKLGGTHSYIPCTPNGCLELIKKTGVKIEGAQAVVIGRSQIVGSPMAQLLIWNNATVTVCHSRTVNLPAICRQADILVVAIGQPLYVKREWIKPGAVVIDCGITSIPDSSRKSGQRLVGDVDFEQAKEVASYITPVPGGVGPMTVAMLISNTVDAAIRVSSSS